MTGFHWVVQLQSRDPASWIAELRSVARVWTWTDCRGKTASGVGERQPSELYRPLDRSIPQNSRPRRRGHHAAQFPANDAGRPGLLKRPANVGNRGHPGEARANPSTFPSCQDIRLFEHP